MAKGDGDEAGDTSNHPFTISALPAPVVQGVSPGHGPLTGGTTITVIGQNFVSGCKVKVGGADATEVSVLSSGQLTAVTPPHVGAEAVGVHVVNPNGQAVPCPTDSPTRRCPPRRRRWCRRWRSNHGLLTGGTAITITGQNFVSGCKVRLGGVDATGVVFVSGTQVRAVTPPGSVAGPVNVRVVNPDDQAGHLDNAFTYDVVPAPVVQGVSPGHGPQAGGTTITVTGQNFVPGCKVKLGGADATGVSFVAATQVRAVTPPGSAAGAVNVRVANPDGQAGHLDNAFTYDAAPTPPTVRVLYPNGGEALQPGQSVTIRWQSSASVGVAAHDVKFSANGGGTFVDLATNLPGAARASPGRSPASRQAKG